MDADLGALPEDIDALRAALLLERARMREVTAERDVRTAELAVARAKASDDLALIAHKKLRIAKLERQIYGPRSERSSLLIEQMALQFEEADASATKDELAAERAAANVTSVTGFMADAVGSACAALAPLRGRLEFHVMAAERLHGDDTTVPVLAKGKTDTARCWVYVRDDRPFGGTSPPAAMFYYSRDRKGEHPRLHLAGYSGIFQADAFDGYRQLYLADRSPGRIIEAACWVHARRPFFAMADLDENARRKAAGKKEIPLSPIAIEIVRRIDALFEIEQPINGTTPNDRRAVRQSLSKPLVDDLLL